VAGFYDITAGIAHTCAITTEFGVQCWGDNAFGQLGDGTNRRSTVPVNVLGLDGGLMIDAGGNHTCLLAGSDVWCWGENSDGQLGDGTTEDSNVPVHVLTGAREISAGLDYTCASMLTGQVMCWGNNSEGQLADNTRTDRSEPVLATLVGGLSEFDAGQTQNCGLTADGLVSCLVDRVAQLVGGFIPVTGADPEPNRDLQVSRFSQQIVAINRTGNPVTFDGDEVRLVSEVAGMVEADSGVGHTCGLLGSGTVKCWGANNFGQLGNNASAASEDPVSVVNLSGASELAVGENHSCVIVPTDAWGLTVEIACWGLNTDGQLGNGRTVNSRVPVWVVED
jgi:hypothetical protein